MDWMKPYKAMHPDSTRHGDGRGGNGFDFEVGDLEKGAEAEAEAGAGPVLQPPDLEGLVSGLEGINWLSDSGDMMNCTLGLCCCRGRTARHG